MSLYYHSCTFEIVGLDLKDEGKLCRTLDKSSLNLVAVAWTFTFEFSVSEFISWSTIFTTLITKNVNTVWFDCADGDTVFVEATDNTDLFIRLPRTINWGDLKVQEAEISFLYALT